MPAGLLPGRNGNIQDSDLRVFRLCITQGAPVRQFRSFQQLHYFKIAVIGIKTAGTNDQDGQEKIV